MKSIKIFFFTISIISFIPSLGQNLESFKLSKVNLSNHSLESIDLPIWDDFSSSNKLNNLFWSEGENISIKDLTDTPAGFGTAGQALVMNSSANALEFANASSAEVYGFEIVNIANNPTLRLTTTNGGADNISSTAYANFDEVQYAATGFSWSLNASGNLIATV